MATPFKPRSTKQRLADTRLTVRRGATAGADSESRDPFSPDRPPKRTGFASVPKFKSKAPRAKASSRGKPRGGFGGY